MGHTMFSSKAHKLEDKIAKETVKAETWDFEHGESEHDVIHREGMFNKGRYNYASQGDAGMAKHMAGAGWEKFQIKKIREKERIAERHAENRKQAGESENKWHSGLHNETYTPTEHKEEDSHTKEHAYRSGFDRYKDEPGKNKYLEGAREWKNKAFDTDSPSADRHREIHREEEAHDEKDYLTKAEKGHEHEGDKYSKNQWGFQVHGLKEAFKSGHQKTAQHHKPWEAGKYDNKPITTPVKTGTGEATYTASQTEHLKSRATTRNSRKTKKTATVSEPTTVSSSASTTERVTALSKSVNRRNKRGLNLKQTVAGVKGE